MPYSRHSYQIVLDLLQQDILVYQKLVEQTTSFIGLRILLRQVDSLIGAGYYFMKSVILSDYVMEMGDHFNKMHSQYNVLKVGLSNKISYTASVLEINQLSSRFILEKKIADMQAKTSFFPQSAKEARFHELRLSQCDKNIKREAEVSVGIQDSEKVTDEIAQFLDEHQAYTAMYQAICLIQGNHLKAAQKQLKRIIRLKEESHGEDESPYLDDVIKKAQKTHQSILPSISCHSFFKDKIFSFRRSYRVLPIVIKEESEEEKLTQEQKDSRLLSLQTLYYGFTYFPIIDMSKIAGVDKVVFVDFDETLVNKAGQIIGKDKWINVLKQASLNTLFFICTARNQCKTNTDEIMRPINLLQQEAGVNRFYGILSTCWQGKTAPIDSIFFPLLKRFPHVTQKDAILLDDNSDFLIPCKEAGYSVIKAHKDNDDFLDILSLYLKRENKKSFNESDSDEKELNRKVSSKKLS